MPHDWDADAGISPVDAALAPTLGRFLAELHALPVPPGVAALVPGDEIGRARLAARAPRLKERLVALAPGLAPEERAGLLALVDELARAAPHGGPAGWVHGDLYARHLLVDDRRKLTGIIDWGDVHLGDPALDLSILYSFLTPPARTAFREAYGPIDADTERRARFRALHHGAMLLEQGVAADDPTLGRLGQRALAGALQAGAA